MSVVRENSDDLAWDRSDELFEEALKHVRLTSTCRKIEAFAQKIYGNTATLVTPLVVGGFNVLYPIRIEGLSQQFLVRLPCPDQALFPEEKILAEAATADYLTEFSQLPVPKVFYNGVDPEIGPYMIIQDLNTRRPLAEALETPREDHNDSPVLNSDITEVNLKDLYKKMARCALQLIQPTFPRIGSIRQLNLGVYQVSGRPITLNMSNMVQLANVPTSVFPPEGTTYQTTDDWYTALAEMQMATLIFQHNDFVSSEDDCRTKYCARQLVRRLAKQGRLAKFGFAEDSWSAQSKNFRATLPAPNNYGSFRLWSDDFRPVNVLVDEKNEVLGAIDWEFTYAAPAQFALDPPWWLLLETPEAWDNGIEDWILVYEKRLKTWLEALEEAESDMEPGSLLLSLYMRESWKTGRFWLNYAARKSWVFDFIYWRYLDERFYGDREEKFPDDIPMEYLWKTRVHLLTDEERGAMESLVQNKMEESKERVLVEWDASEAKQRMSSFLFE